MEQTTERVSVLVLAVKTAQEMEWVLAPELAVATASRWGWKLAKV
jgi:hypothetical protein